MKSLLGLGVLCAVLVSPALAQGKESKIGEWLVIETSDAFTDETRGVVALQQDGNAIAVKCDEPGPVYIQVLFDKYVGEGSNGKREVTLRFDSDPPYKERWVHDNTYAAQFDGPASDKFARRLASAKKFAIQAFSYDYETRVAIFELNEDARKAISTVYKLCKAGVIE